MYGLRMANQWRRLVGAWAGGSQGAGAPTAPRRHSCHTPFLEPLRDVGWGVGGGGERVWSGGQGRGGGGDQGWAGRGAGGWGLVRAAAAGGGRGTATGLQGGGQSLSKGWVVQQLTPLRRESNVQRGACLGSGGAGGFGRGSAGAGREGARAGGGSCGGLRLGGSEGGEDDSIALHVGAAARVSSREGWGGGRVGFWRAVWGVCALGRGAWACSRSGRRFGGAAGCKPGATCIRNTMHHNTWQHAPAEVLQRACRGACAALWTRGAGAGRGGAARRHQAVQRVGRGVWGAVCV